MLRAFINPLRFSTRNRLPQKLSQRLYSRAVQSAMDEFKHYFPVVGVAVGLTALTFQVLVLFPWHETLSNDFSALEDVTKRIEATEIKLEEKLDSILKLEVEVKAKERKILDLQSEILAKLDLITKNDVHK